MLTVLCAHRAEAEPWIGRYDLTPMGNDPGLFRGRGIRLLLTGQGMVRCTATLERLGDGLLPGPGHHWLNFGVAGADPGVPEGWLPNETPWPGALAAIRGLNFLDRQWQLALPPQMRVRDGVAPPVDLVTDCISVGSPERKFDHAAVYDMEAGAIGAFLDARGLMQYLVVIKMVTDGPQDPPRTGITLARRLLRQHVRRIADLGSEYVSC